MQKPVFQFPVTDFIFLKPGLIKPLILVGVNAVLVKETKFTVMCQHFSIKCLFGHFRLALLQTERKRNVTKNINVGGHYMLFIVK